MTIIEGLDNELLSFVKDSGLFVRTMYLPEGTGGFLGAMGPVLLLNPEMLIKSNHSPNYVLGHELGHAIGYYSGHYVSQPISYMARFFGLFPEWYAYEEMCSVYFGAMVAHMFDGQEHDPFDPKWFLNTWKCMTTKSYEDAYNMAALRMEMLVRGEVDFGTNYSWERDFQDIENDWEARELFSMGEFL